MQLSAPSDGEKLSQPKGELTYHGVKHDAGADSIPRKRPNESTNARARFKSTFAVVRERAVGMLGDGGCGTKG